MEARRAKKFWGGENRTYTRYFGPKLVLTFFFLFFRKQVNLEKIATYSYTRYYGVKTQLTLDIIESKANRSEDVTQQLGGIY